MSEPSKAVRWLPLEANPEVFEDYMQGLGVGRVRTPKGDECSLCVEELLGVEPWALDMLRQTDTVCVLMLYPLTAQDTTDVPQHQRIETGTNIWFTKQTVGNACGTVALLHCLANVSRDKFPLEEGSVLKSFFEKTNSLSPDARAEFLSKDTALAHAHAAQEHSGQTAAPSLEAEVTTHFVCFLPIDGALVELDGRKEAPKSHGKIPQGKTFLQACVSMIKREFMDTRTNIRFAILAVGDVRSAKLGE